MTFPARWVTKSCTALASAASNGFSGAAMTNKVLCGFCQSLTSIGVDMVLATLKSSRLARIRVSCCSSYSPSLSYGENTVVLFEETTAMTTVERTTDTRSATISHASRVSFFFSASTIISPVIL